MKLNLRENPNIKQLYGGTDDLTSQLRFTSTEGQQNPYTNQSILSPREIEKKGDAL